MDSSSGPGAAPRGVRRSLLRDRRDRGRRGPDYGRGVPARLTPRQRFDRTALGVLTDIENRCGDRLPTIELAVEDVPIVPEQWPADRVPLCSLVPARREHPARVVLFRRPIELRVDTPTELSALVLTVLAEQLADLIGVRPEEIHPDYPG